MSNKRSNACNIHRDIIIGHLFHCYYLITLEVLCPIDSSVSSCIGFGCAGDYGDGEDGEWDAEDYVKMEMEMMLG